MKLFSIFKLLLFLHLQTLLKQIYEEGIDELVLYDITASREKRDIMIELVEKVASQIFIPFSAGGRYPSGSAGRPWRRRRNSRRTRPLRRAQTPSRARHHAARRGHSGHGIYGLYRR